MSGNSLALDTSRAIGVLNGEPTAVASISGWLETCLPVPVVAELRFGALNSQNVAKNQQRVEALVAACRVLPATASTADEYARLRLALKRKRTPIPENDLWIAALCAEYGLPLATDDGHFAAVPGLTIVSR
jgi:predicted nucleic acid-binding protein